MSAPKTFTTAEVAKHTQRGDVWTVIHGKVYDISKFLDDHPGGEEVLLETAGADSTEGFEDVGHSEDARELLQKYYIGEVEGGKAAAPAKPAAAAPAPAQEQGGSFFWAIPVAIAAIAAIAYTQLQ
ncbi:Cytochrome b5 [Allomyces arbusculus]|nr:Cytochrome b5 [Allomyces arbusculus]